MQPEARLSHRIREAITKDPNAFGFKVHGSGMMMAGLPDLVFCINGLFVGIETKMPGNEPTPRQRFVHDRIRAAGGVVIVAHSVEEARAGISRLFEGEA